MLALVSLRAGESGKLEYIAPDKMTLGADFIGCATGTQILIPQGSKLIGTYTKKAVNNGRLAVDGAGYTGIAGKVQHHTGQKITARAVGASIAAHGSLAAGNVSANNNSYTAGQIAAQGAMANLI